MVANRRQALKPWHEIDTKAPAANGCIHSNFLELANFFVIHGPLTRYAKLRVAHAPGMAGTFSRHRLQRKQLDSDLDMHHGRCATHVPWCALGSLTRGGRENVPGIPGACITLNFTYLARTPCLFLGPIPSLHSYPCVPINSLWPGRF